MRSRCELAMVQKFEVVAINTLSLDSSSTSFLHDEIIKLSEISVVEGWKSC
jgi:hypothetical protein